MILVHPRIDFEAKCPRDGTDLSIVDVVIPGMRCLADAECQSCGGRFYVDLPVSHALWNPMALDRATGEVFDRRGEKWFSEILEKSFRSPETSETVPVVKKFFDARKIVLVNCLDFLYGHSLLKLLNVQRHLAESPEWGCCVLVPPSLVHLVPDGVAEIWEFPVPLKDGWRWHVALSRWIRDRISRSEACRLSPAFSHPSSRVYDLRKFARDLPEVSGLLVTPGPVILFSYREDRLWGRTSAEQGRKLQRLYEFLGKIFPDMVFVLVGFGRKNSIRPGKAKVVDLRTDAFDRERDKLWLACMNAADCVVGVHGSNMLLPSGLAWSVVDLVPQSRLGNIFQDNLFQHDLSDVRDALLQYRSVYGNDFLSDVSPSRVGEIVVSILALNERNSSWFKTGEGGDPHLIRHKPETAQRALRAMSSRRGAWGKIKKGTETMIQEALGFFLHRLD